MRRAIYGVVLLCAGCGRSDLAAFAIDETCEAASGSGCSFYAAPGLHLVDHTAPSLGIAVEDGEPDGVFVVNPDPSVALRLRVREAAFGSTTFATREDDVVLQPGERRIVEIAPRRQAAATTRHLGGMVSLDADRPFHATVYRPFRSFVGNDSEMLLPTQALGRSYVVASYPPHPAQFQGAGDPSYFEVIALDEPAKVQWHAAQATAGDGDRIPPVAAGAWSPPLTLRPFESIRVTGAELSAVSPELGDVSGTVVQSTTDVIVIGGSRCATVPPSTDGLVGCDPLIEQLLPVRLWSDRVAVPHPPLRTTESHYVRIYAGANAVEIRTDPPVLAQEPSVLPRRGDFVDVVVPHGTSFSVDADGPILAVGYLATRDPADQIGDPAMYQLVPSDRLLSRYVVSTGAQWTTHLLQIVRERQGAPVHVDAVTVDGWESFGAYETAVVEVDEGTHVVESDDEFGVTQFGWTNDVHDACKDFPGFGSCQTSYAHPAGMRYD